MKFYCLFCLSVFFSCLACADEGGADSLREQVLGDSLLQEGRPTDTSFVWSMPYGMVDVNDSATQIPASVRPLFDVPIRDTQIGTGPDGWYYLTGTTAGADGQMIAWNDGVHVWKSKDLKHWESLGLVVDLNSMDSWIRDFYVCPKDYASPGVVVSPKALTTSLKALNKEHHIRRAAWANEIHYVPSQNTFFIAGCINHNIWIPEKHRFGHGFNGATFLLRSISGKAEGPYVDVQPKQPLTASIDASLFVDDDASAWWVYKAHHMVRLKDDLSGLAEEPALVDYTPIKGVRHEEGAFLFKANGKYHFTTTSWSVASANSEWYTYDHSQGMDKYSYDPLVATSDNVRGPYGEMRNTVSGGGHGNFFQDHEGQWWACIFWNPKNINNPQGLDSRPAIVAMKWRHDRFVVDRGRTDAFYAEQ